MVDGVDEFIIFEVVGVMLVLWDVFRFLFWCLFLNFLGFFLILLCILWLFLKFDLFGVLLWEFFSFFL